MTTDEFGEYFKVLDKASERLRNVIYVSVIIFTAMLIYGINAFAYPASQYAFDAVDLAARCHAVDNLNPKCSKPKKVETVQSFLPPPVPGLYEDLSRHQLQSAYDESIKDRTFAFPVFGLNTDRDLLWILFPLVGIFGYYIMLLALDSVTRLFKFILDENQTDIFRLRLIQSTLVITTPLTRGKKIRGIGDMGPVVRFMWRAVATLIYAIPMIVSALIMMDQMNVLPVYLYKVDGELFFDSPSNLLIAQLVAEGVLFVVQTALLVTLMGHARSFGECQERVELLIG